MITTKRNYVFDFDSTLTRVEALDVLAEITLKNNPKKDEIIQQIIDITNLGIDGEISFTETAKKEPSRMNFKVTLGIMPDYIFDGEGMRVDGVKLERPGSKAGMQKGDIIIGMGDSNIENIQDYMKALSSYNKNDQTTVTIRRNNEVKILNVTF